MTPTPTTRLLPAGSSVLCELDAARRSYSSALRVWHQAGKPREGYESQTYDYAARRYGSALTAARVA